MKRERARLAIGRVRQAVLIFCGIVIAGLCIEIVLLAVHSGTDPVGLNRSREFSMVPPADPVANDGQSAIDTVLALPLFVQGRGQTPAPVVAEAALAPPPPPAPEPEIRLLGVQLSDKARLAIIHLSNADQALRAVEGQPVGNWTLVRILRDHVELTRDSQTRYVYLGDTKPPTDEAASQ